MSNFQLYCKNLKTCNISTHHFDINIFQKYLEIYKKIYCHKSCKTSYQDNMKNYIDQINSISNSNSVKIGKYFLNHKNILYQLVNINKKKPNSYLVVPAYDSCFDCELQIGLTGSIKMGEHPVKCLKREVEEEIGIILHKGIKVNPKINNVYYYEVEINNNYSIKEGETVQLEKRRDTKYKVSCLVYGSLKDTKDLLVKTKLPYHFIKGEDISHTVLVPIELAIILTEKIMSYKCDRNHAKGCRLCH